MAIARIAAEMRDVARRERVGRLALLTLWIGLACLSMGVTTLQLTPDMHARNLV